VGFPPNLLDYNSYALIFVNTLGNKAGHDAVLDW